jgi:hypothetical protein
VRIHALSWKVCPRSLPLSVMAQPQTNTFFFFGSVP